MVSVSQCTDVRSGMAENRDIDIRLLRFLVTYSETFDPFSGTLFDSGVGFECQR